VTTGATGEAIFTLFSDSTVGSRVNVGNIQNVTATHIHEGGPGATGPVIVGFFGGLFNGSGLLAEGTFRSSDVTGMDFDELLTRMRAGTVYLNEHTRAARSATWGVRTTGIVCLAARLSTASAGRIWPKGTTACW